MTGVYIPDCSGLPGEYLRLCWHTWSHLFNGELIDEMMVVFVQGAVQGHAVGLEEKVLQQRDDYDGQIFFMLTAFRSSLSTDTRHQAW
jgi:hypothetical protein